MTWPKLLLRCVLIVVTFFLCLLLFAVLTADAAVLCGRKNLETGELREGNVRLRLDACRRYEAPIGVVEGTAVPVEGPPGPPGPAGEAGPVGPAWSETLRLSCVLRNTALKPDGTAGGGTTLPIETACLPDEDAIECGAYTIGGNWMLLPCYSRPVGYYGLARCCRILSVGD